MNIHVLGVEKEVDMAQVYVELGYLLPHTQINLLFVGNEISPKIDGKVLSLNNVTIKFVQGVYPQDIGRCLPSRYWEVSTARLDYWFYCCAGHVPDMGDSNETS